jgi:hypothetical protein
MLTLIPAMVNGQPLTINSFGKLVVKDFPEVNFILNVMAQAINIFMMN